MARTAFDRGRLVRAFDYLGRDLASRGVLLALANLDHGERDMADAKMLARESRIADVDALQRLHASIHGERPSVELLASFASVLA